MDVHEPLCKTVRMPIHCMQVTSHFSNLPVPHNSMLGKPLLLVASLLLSHAVYTVYNQLSHLKALRQPDKPISLNIVYYECTLALITGVLGASLNAPPLKDITWASEMRKRTIDEMDARPGFANYISRARSLHRI